jgi:hypothetical protein
MVRNELYYSLIVTSLHFIPHQTVPVHVKRYFCYPTPVQTTINTQQTVPDGTSPVHTHHTYGHTYPTLYVYKSQSSLNPNPNRTLPDRPQYGLSATCDIAQQYSPASIVSLRFHSRNHKIWKSHKYVIIIMIVITIWPYICKNHVTIT